MSHDVRAHVDNVAARTPAQREGVSAHGIYNEVARGRHRAHRREIDGYLRAEPDLQVAFIIINTLLAKVTDARGRSSVCAVSTSK